MFSRLRDKYDVIEEQINNIGAIMAKNLQVEEFLPNHETNTVVSSL